jgi:hypothetical protein
MKLPWHDKKFLLLIAAIVCVIGLEILSLMGIEIPMPYAPFVFAAFILGIGYGVLRNGVKALFKLKVQQHQFAHGHCCCWRILPGRVSGSSCSNSTLCDGRKARRHWH